MKYLFVIIAIVLQTHAANILFIFPLPSPSHKIPIHVLVKGLISRGHNVTLISPYTAEKKIDNYTEIILENVEEYKEKSLKHVMTANVSSSKGVKALLQSDEIVRITLDSSGVKNLLQSKQNFDVIIQQLTLCDALLGVGYHLKAPTIIFNTVGTMLNIDKITGNSHPSSYVPNMYLGLTDEMTFIERLKNTVTSFMSEVMYSFVIAPVQDKVLHEYFPDAPSLTTLASNVSLVLLSAHYSIVETPRPYMPNMIPIGGFHVQPQSLPQDLKTYIEEANDGVIFFSLGSNFKSADLPSDKLDIILNTFTEFPQRFLWKFEDETLKVPPNVLIRKWLPQVAILSHPNVKAFITHGGLFSVTEAVYHAVPFIGIPVFGDQNYNVANAVHKRFALKYDFKNLTKEDFTAVIREILENPSYKENIAVRSSILRNQPVPPLELALYWIEHVAKYGGAPHLQSAGVRLGWVQAYLIDVLLFVLLIFITIVYVCYKVFKILLKYICAKRKYKKE